MAKDVFVEIARTGAGGRKELLHEPCPIEHTRVVKELKGVTASPVPTQKKMDNADELKAELEKMRRAYAPFLNSCAPGVKDTRKKIFVRDFILDGKEKITLPHYEGPVGNATRIYESDFVIDSIGDDECVYICIGGADYIAEVFVNDELAGCHEGFFATFEFDITSCARQGTNHLKIVLKNDFVYNGYENSLGETLQGDKLYAATGIGWDDPALGWHHCPPGMGLYDEVCVEIRNKTHIHDLFVRPLVSQNCAEAWIETENTEYVKKDVSFRISVYGYNFEETVFENQVFCAGDKYITPAQKGTNIYKFRFAMDNARLWNTDTPYLYVMNIELIYNDTVTDCGCVKFGMREFTQDLDGQRKGMLYLNGNKIRLRGANTMGYEQLSVMRGDFDELADDILLAKICNMNYLRITQRPVQSKVYDYCDMLGIMVQTDLPLFGVMRRTKVAEGIRQAEEMERHIRSHPSCVMVTYINEPVPDIKCEPHRHLERPELEEFFAACNMIVHLNNPDRIIKHVDGDFNPPTAGMPDIHCYTGWYNGHGVDMGKLIKGYNVEVKPGWYYGCGEYGAEGLEDASVMRKYYPEEWLREPFDPGRIVKAQTKNVHYHFYDTQDTLEDWIEASQNHQALATTLMTDAYRRDSRMISSVIHLFIDAWPSGWMKTIMDCERNPKKAFFAYCNSLEKIKVSLRTDRFTCTSGENMSVEAYICNDSNNSSDSCKLHFELYRNSTLIASSVADARMEDCDVSYIADAVFTAPDVKDREVLVLKAILTDSDGKAVCYDELAVEVFAPADIRENDKVEFITNLPEGTHSVAGETVVVRTCGMSPMHFVSRKTGHEIVKEFKPRDFSYWYNAKEDMITPILHATFECDGFTPVLTSGNCGDDNTCETGAWHTVNAVAIKVYEGKLYVISQVDLRTENPVAKRFVRNIYEWAENNL